MFTTAAEWRTTLVRFPFMTTAQPRARALAGFLLFVAIVVGVVGLSSGPMGAQEPPSSAQLGPAVADLTVAVPSTTPPPFLPSQS